MVSTTTCRGGVVDDFLEGVRGGVREFVAVVLRNLVALGFGRAVAAATLDTLSEEEIDSSSDSWT
jgi:hypothetical protein